MYFSMYTNSQIRWKNLPFWSKFLIHPMGEAICCPDQNSWCYYFNENSSASHLKTFFIDYLKQKNCRKFVWNTDLTSNHQTTNLVFPNFFNEFFSTWAVEKENKLLVQNSFFFSFGPIFLFSFSTFQTEKKIVFKIGDSKIGCLALFDVTNKIQKKHSNNIHNKDSDLKSSWAKYWKLLHCTIYFQICCNKEKSWTFFESVNS